MTEVTVGIDIGTSSVKALAVDGDGTVVASARVPHEYRVPAPGRLEHDAAVAWRDGPLAARAALRVDDVRGVSVSAMVPSLTAVDAAGMPLLPGLLYGDERPVSSSTASFVG
jgi:xylulokinase